MKQYLPIAVFCLGACAPGGTPSPTLPAGASTASTQGPCDAAKVQDLVGKSGATTPDAKARSGTTTVRTYVTGSPLTMDFRPDRLNVETDASGTIVRLSCG